MSDPSGPAQPTPAEPADRPETDDQADHVVLIGYVGETEEPGRLRLYPTPERDAYVEFAEADLVRHEPGARPDEESAVWLPSHAELVYSRESREQVFQAWILDDDILPVFFENPVIKCPASRH